MDHFKTFLAIVGGASLAFLAILPFLRVEVFERKTGFMIYGANITELARMFLDPEKESEVTFGGILGSFLKAAISFRVTLRK